MRKWLKRGLKMLFAVTLLAVVGAAAWFARDLGRKRERNELIRRAEARVEAGERAAAVSLRLDLVGPGLGREARVPVLPPGVSLIEAKLDGAPAEIDMQDGRHVLVLRGGGERVAELRYSVCLGAERRLPLALPRAISTVVEIGLPQPGMAVTAPAPAIVEMLETKSGSAARILTPPTEMLDLSWFPRPSGVVTATRLGARTETLYTVQGDSLGGRTTYSLRVDGRDVAQLVFALPAGLAVDQVEGAWVKGWKSEKGTLTVEAGGALSGELALVVTHRRPLGAEAVDLSVPELKGAVRQWGFGAVATAGAVEIRSLDVDNGQTVDPRGLPAALRSAGEASVALAFRYDGLPSKQKLALVRHREMEVLEATCDSLHALLVHTAEGRAMGKAVYMVRNARRQHLEVRLPDGAELWSAYVGGKPVRPAAAEGGKTLIPLSCTGETAGRGFAVELVYFFKGEAFREQGKFAAALPEVDVPVMNVMLSVSVPEDVTLEDFAGGLKPVRAFAFSLDPQDDKLVRETREQSPSDAQVADLNKQLDEQLAQGNIGNRRLRLDYQALNSNPNFQKALRFNNDNANFVRQYYLENGAAPAATGAPGQPATAINLVGFGQDELARITGLASLSVAVPAGGRVYRFEHNLVSGKVAPVSADYWSSRPAKPAGEAELRLASDVAAVYALSQRGLHLDAELAYRLTGGKVGELVYALPAGTKVLGLEGGNVAEYSAENGTLHVRLVRPERSGGKLLLRAELPVPAAESKLAAPRLAGAAEERVLVGIGAPEDYALEFPGAEKLERIAPRSLPAGLRDGHRQFSAFRLDGAGAAAGLRLRAVRHGEVKALSATCDSVNAITFFTEEGLAVTRVIWEIRNVSRRHLRLELPEGAELWGAFASDRAVKPLAGEGGAVLVPLECAEDGQLRSFPVEAVYVLRGKAFERRGDLASRLPKADVPVMHAMYSLYLPEKVRTARSEGTLKEVRAFSGPLVRTEGSLGPRAEGAAAPAVDDLRARYAQRQEALERNVSQRQLEGAMRAAAAKAGASGHPGTAAVEPAAACGLKIYIPAVGRLLRFERHVALDGELEVKCAYRM